MRQRKKGKHNILSFEEVRKRFENKGYTLLENEYVNGTTKMKFVCDIHPEQEQFTTVEHLSSKNGVPCRYCKRQDLKGENNFNWNGGITTIYKAVREHVAPWVLDSMKAYDFKCAITGLDGKKHVHHYRKNNKELITSVLREWGYSGKKKISEFDSHTLTLIGEACLKLHYKHGLGIPILEPLHILFHKLYGYRNNTPQQFEEFTKRYNLKEFNDTKVLPKKLWKT